ncbi:MAG: ankyrin repeat domain-containing protein [Bacteroidota bacterium]
MYRTKNAWLPIIVALGVLGCRSYQDPILPTGTIPDDSISIFWNALRENDLQNVSYHLIQYPGLASSNLIVKDPDETLFGEVHTPLTYAAWYGSTKCMRYLLQEHRPLLNRSVKFQAEEILGYARPTNQGQTPTITAVRAGRAEVVQMILSYKPDLAWTDAEGRTPLEFAVQEGHLEITAILLQHGANPNQANSKDNKRAPIHLAATYHDDPRMLQLLLGHRANIYQNDSTGLNVLHWAVISDNPKCVRYLIQHYKWMRRLVMRMEFLSWAIKQSRSLKSIRCIVNHGHSNAGIQACYLACCPENGQLLINPRKDLERLPLYQALKQNRYQVVHYLAQRHWPTDVKLTEEGICQTLLHVAAQTPHNREKARTIKCLIKYGAKLDVQDSLGRTPMDCIEDTGIRDEIVQYARKIRSPQTHTFVSTLIALIQEANQSDDEILQVMQCGYDQDIHDHFYILRAGGAARLIYSPLFIAIIYERPAVVKYLIEQGASLDVHDDTGYTLLHHALKRQVPLSIISLLLVGGADVNAMDDLGNTALHLAVLGENPDIALVELLMKHGADPDIYNRYKQVPMHMAVQRNHCQFVEIFSKYHADLHLTDKTGNTPLHIAIKIHKQGEASHNMISMAKLLLSYGANPYIRNRQCLTPADLMRRHADVAIRMLEVIAMLPGLSV